MTAGLVIVAIGVVAFALKLAFNVRRSHTDRLRDFDKELEG